MATHVGAARRLAALLVLLGAALAAPAAAAETLYGSIDAGGVIGLRHADGRAVSQISPGPYTFEVTDNERIHNFHLLGTAVETPIDQSLGVFTFADVMLAAGSYTYRCDVHPTVFGTFGVNEPPPPATAPGRVTRVRVVTVRGRRSVVVSLSFTRAARATVHLRRSGRFVAGVRKTLQPGRRTIRIPVPRRARGGLYGVRVTLTESGRTYFTTRSVRVPGRR